MERQELRDRASALKTEKQAFLNDTYLWVKVAGEAVQRLPDTELEFEVPKAGGKGGMRKVKRRDGKKLKERIAGRDIYNSAFVSMVAAIEDYLVKIMRWILLTEQKRIKCTIPGIGFTKEIAVVDLIDQEKDSLIEAIIEQRIEHLFYAGPQKQREYFDTALGIEIDDDIWGKWVEIKARRDLWVHNGGVVNQIYLEKAKDYKLCKLNEEAKIDSAYFEDCVKLLKTMTGRINKKIREVYPVQQQQMDHEE